MSSTKFLDFQYSRNKYTPNPKRLFSFSNKQYSSNFPIFQPNEDEMRRVFDRFDKDKDRLISQQDYKAILGAIREDKSIVSEVGRIFQVADLNEDGYIDFQEFMALHKDGGGIGVRAMDIQNAFRAFDSDEDGKISAEEVYDMLNRLGDRPTLEDCRSMVKAVDTDRDGFINLSEFWTMMTRNMTRY